MSEKETSEKVASLASRLMRVPEDATSDEIRTLAASCLSQREEECDEDELEGYKKRLEELEGIWGEVVRVKKDIESEVRRVGMKIEEMESDR